MLGYIPYKFGSDYGAFQEFLRHSGRAAMSMEWQAEAFQRPDFDIPDVVVTEPTSRILLVIEGERSVVGPIIEKAHEVMESLKEGS